MPILAGRCPRTVSTTQPATTSALIEHPAPNLEPGDVVVLVDGREALVTARVEAEPGPLTALLEVAIAPTPLTSDESIA